MANVRVLTLGDSVILFVFAPIIVRGDWSTAMISIYSFILGYELMRIAARFTKQKIRFVNISAKVSALTCFH